MTAYNSTRNAQKNCTEPIKANDRTRMIYDCINRADKNRLPCMYNSQNQRRAHCWLWGQNWIDPAEFGEVAIETSSSDKLNSSFSSCFDREIQFFPQNHHTLHRRTIHVQNHVAFELTRLQQAEVLREWNILKSIVHQIWLPPLHIWAFWWL